MKLFLTSFLLLATTSLFAGTTYTFTGTNPLSGNACYIGVNMIDDSTMHKFEFIGAHHYRMTPGKNDTTDDDVRRHETFDLTETELTDGLSQTQSRNSNSTLFIHKYKRIKIVIDFKGKSVAEAKSVSYARGAFPFAKITFNCNDLKVTSVVVD